MRRLRLLPVVSILLSSFVQIATSYGALAESSSSTSSWQAESLKHSGITSGVVTVSRIYGGSTAPDGRFAYAQITLMKDGTTLQCGASLISPDILLTAAHCHGWWDSIHVDRHSLTAEETEDYQIRVPVEAIPHEAFNPDNFENDVAVILLNEAVEGIQPIRLNQNSSQPAEGDELTVVGFGATARSGGKLVFPGIFQQTKLPYVPNDECEAFRFQDKTLYKGLIFRDMLCAGKPGVDACAGDSGSALFLEGAADDSNHEDVQYGIVSWGSGCAVYPGVYSRVSEHFPWIQNHVCLMSNSPPEYFNCQRNQWNPGNVVGKAQSVPAASVPITTMAPSTTSPVTIMPPTPRPSSVMPTTQSPSIITPTSSAPPTITLTPPTRIPTTSPTGLPTWIVTAHPTTRHPTSRPSSQPTRSAAPTVMPTKNATAAPTAIPTLSSTTAILRERTKIDEVVVAKVVVVGSNESILQPKEETSHGSIRFQHRSPCLLMILGILLFAWTW